MSGSGLNSGYIVRAWSVVAGAIAAACASGPAMGQAANFVDVTNGHLLRQTGTDRGVAWIDADGDGRLDLYITNWGGANKLYRNEGPDHFVDRTAGLPTGVYQGDVDGDGWVGASDLAQVLGSWGQADPVADVNNDGVVNAQDLAIVLGDWAPPPNSLLANAGSGLSGRAVWADYDNDGLVDVYISQSGGSVLLRNEGGLVFSEMTNGQPLSMGGKIVRAAAWGDYDNNGFVDLYVSAHGGSDNRNALIRNDSVRQQFDDVSVWPMDDDGVGRGMAWADFDNDGDQDLYLANGHQGIPGVPPGPATNKLFVNNGGVFFDGTNGPLGNTGNGRGVAWGDYDNDGFLDIYVSNLKVEGVGGANVLLRNEGNGLFTDATHGLLGDTSQSRCCSWVDFDNDGDLDLLVINSGTFHKFFRNDNHELVPIDARPMITNVADGNSAAWADYDRDGDMDVYIAVAGGLSRLFRNDLDNGNHWIVVELTGTVSNRSAIGARITATTGGLTQIREVQAGSGYMAQHMFGAHFGFGAAEIIDTLTVRWPSGTVQVFEDVAVDQYLELIEPE